MSLLSRLPTTSRLSRRVLVQSAARSNSTLSSKSGRDGSGLSSILIANRGEIAL